MKAKHTFKAPAFQLYAKEFLQDEAVIAMDLEAVGGYLILLCHQWNEGSVPADVSLMARICRTTPERMQKIWPQIAPKFSPLRGNKNRFVNPKLEIVRNEKMRFSRKQADSGERGAQKRWTNKPHDGNGLNGVAHASAIGSRWASDSSGSGSVYTPPTPSQEGAGNGILLDPDELPFATSLDPQPEMVKGNGHYSAGAGENGNGGALKTGEALGSQQEIWFEAWWAEYWHRRAKKAAWGAFKKHVRTEARFQVVMAATRAQKPEMLQRESSKRPYGATWLNGERWEDEIQASAPNSNEPPRMIL